MSDPDRSNEPYDMRLSAAALHEYYCSLLNAGFRNSEAMYIVACMVSGGPRHPEEGQ